MSEEVAKYQIHGSGPTSFPAMLQMAEVLIASGFLPEHIKKPAQAVAIMQRGRELGLPPMEALCTLYIVHGKVSCDTKTMLALAWRSGVLAKLEILESTDERCTVRLQRRGGEPTEFTYTIQDAKRLGLMRKGGGPYDTQPRVMNRWRVIAEGLRVVCPDPLAGLYTHEEMNLPVVVDENGGLVLDSRRVAAGEAREEGRQSLAERIGVEPASTEQPEPQPAAPIAEPEDDPTRPGVLTCAWRCFACGGNGFWDNRAARLLDEIEVAAGTRKAKARPAWRCATPGCEGVIWPADPEEAEKVKKARAHLTAEFRRAGIDKGEQPKWSAAGLGHPPNGHCLADLERLLELLQAMPDAGAKPKARDARPRSPGADIPSASAGGAVNSPSAAPPVSPKFDRAAAIENIEAWLKPHAPEHDPLLTLLMDVLGDRSHEDATDEELKQICKDVKGEEIPF